jgi:hypothetical protein
MKSKKLVVVVLAVFCLVAYLSMSAFAADFRFTANVIEAGPMIHDVSGVPLATPQVQFRLQREGSQGIYWYFATTGQEKEMLATALTAMASTRTVEVWTNSSTGEVYNMLLK